MKDFLPIGSVVLLKETSKKLMIIGRVQVCNDVAYEYSGVMFPEGYVGDNQLFLFNSKDIQRVYYMGMQDEEELDFRALLKENVKEQIKNQEEQKK